MPLEAAVYRGHSKVVRKLLDAGADPNAKGGALEHPLLTAANARHTSPEVCELLISKGADVNHHTSRNGAALMLAAREGNEDIVKVLLKSGADVNLEATQGSALGRAVENDRLNVAILLLDHGADWRQKTENFENALFAASACRQDDRALLETVINSGADVNCRGSTKYTTALEAAAYHGNGRCVHTLLTKGAIDYEGRALRFAGMVKMEYKLVQLLLSHHSASEDTRYTQEEFDEAFRFAGLRGSYGTMWALREYGREYAQAAGVEKDFSMKWEGLMEKLLSDGADPNTKMHGRPLLEIACEAKAWKVIAVLLKHGAEVRRSKTVELAFERIGWRVKEPSAQNSDEVSEDMEWTPSGNPDHDEIIRLLQEQKIDSIAP